MIIIDILITIVCSVLTYGLAFAATSYEGDETLRTSCALSAGITLLIYMGMFSIVVAAQFPCWILILPLLFTWVFLGFAQYGMRFTWKNKDNE